MVSVPSARPQRGLLVDDYSGKIDRDLVVTTDLSVSGQMNGSVIVHPGGRLRLSSQTNGEVLVLEGGWLRQSGQLSGDLRCQGLAEITGQINGHVLPTAASCWWPKGCSGTLSTDVWSSIRQAAGSRARGHPSSAPDSGSGTQTGLSRLPERTGPARAGLPRSPLLPLRGTGRRGTGSIRRRLTAWSTLPQGPEILDGALGVDL